MTSQRWRRAVHDLIELGATLYGGIEGLPAMSEAANYSAFEQLRNGGRVEIRALRPADRADLIAANDRTSAQSLYLDSWSDMPFVRLFPWDIVEPQ